jgi:hypothetical protein
MAMNANESTSANSTASTSAAARSAGDPGSKQGDTGVDRQERNHRADEVPGVAALPVWSFRPQSRMDSGNDRSRL